MFKTISRKYFSQFQNGANFASNTTDFATHLKGSVLEKLKFVGQVKVGLLAIADQGNQFSINNSKEIERTSGSWIQDGFKLGDAIFLIANFNGSQTSATPVVEFTATIGTISDTTIGLTSITEIVTDSSKPRVMDDHAIACKAKFPALLYDYSIVENDDANTFISPYSPDRTGFYYGAIDTTTPTVHNMTEQGGNNSLKMWLSGPATVKYVSSGNPLGLTSPNYDYEHLYEITQEFIINPFYLTEWLDNYNAGTIPDQLAGSKSFKHITRYEFRSALTNSNTSVIGVDSSQRGDVAWINENYNGYSNPYSISNITYQDTASSNPVDALQLKRKTTIKGRLNGSGFANTDTAGIYFFFGIDLSGRTDFEPSLQEQFLWDNNLAAMVAGTITATGANRIKRFKLDFVSVSRIDFEADIEFTADEQALVDPGFFNDTLGKYFIGIQAANTNGVDTSNKVILQADWNDFIIDNDVPGLVTFSNQMFRPHNINSNEIGFSDYKGWKQDGALFSCSMALDKTQNANIKSITAKIIALNSVTGESFELQSYDFNLSDIVVVNASPSYQQLSLDATRGFKLASGDQFNQVTMNFDVPVSGSQNVDLSCAFKFDWQSWVKLNGADTVFYDNAVDSKGMGDDASRYSLANNYTIRLALHVGVKQLTDTATIYRHISPALEIYDWNKDGSTPANWSLLIKTFDTDGNDTGGSILTNKDTVVKSTYTPQSGSTASFSDFWGIHRLEPYLAVGDNAIDEFSSIRDSRIGNLLKATAGETKLKITDFGTYVEVECVIDYTKLDPTLTYNIYSRLGTIRVYARYSIARDIKFLTLDKSEMITLNMPDNGVALSNSLRHAIVDANANIISETAITLDNEVYIAPRIAIAYDIINNGKPNFYMICFTGTATEVYEFVYDGTTWQQAKIYSQNIGGSGPTCIRVDPELSPNGRPYLWFGNRDANIGGQKGFKVGWFDGAIWQFADWKCYNSSSPSNDHCAHPMDVIHDNGNVYVMNYDNPPQTNQYNQGKIAVYAQNSGSSTDPADRAAFGNYALVYNIYRNSGNTENQDGPGNAADMSFGAGFEIIGSDPVSTLPIFLVVHDVTLGTSGSRHFSRIFPNITTPLSEADFTIQTPMAFTNNSYGAPEARSGTASATAQSSPLQRKNQCHILVIDDNTIVTGHQSVPYWVKLIIASWTGASNNSWNIHAPNDPSYPFTSGNILQQ